MSDFTRESSTRAQNKVHNSLHQMDRVENEVSFRKVQPGAPTSGSRRRLAGQKPHVRKRQQSKEIWKYNLWSVKAQTGSTLIGDLKSWVEIFRSGYENYERLLNSGKKQKFSAIDNVMTFNLYWIVNALLLVDSTMSSADIRVLSPPFCTPL